MVSASHRRNYSSPTKPKARVHAPRRLAIILACASTPAAVGFGQTTPAWSTYQGNAAHDGYIPAVLDTSAFSLLWQKSLGSFALDQVTAADGKVFLDVPGYFSGSSGLLALNAASGSQLWSQPFPNVSSMNPPAYADGKVYVQNGKGTSNPPAQLTAFDAATGTQLFQSTFSAQWESYLAPTPYNGNVYVDGGYYGGMYSFNGTSGAQNWFGAVPQYDLWTPAIDGNYAYAFTGSGSTSPVKGVFTVLNLQTGATAASVVDTTYDWTGYSMRESVALGSHNDAFATNGGRLISWDTTLDATHTPHLGWSVTHNFSGQVSVANGVVYAVDGGVLTALDEATGSTLWTWGTGLAGQVILTKNSAFVSNGTSTFAVNLASHAQDWTYAAGGKLSLAENVLYISGAAGTLTAVSVPGLTPFVWNTPSGGSWGNAASWTPAGPAAGTDYVADFSAQTLPADAIVSLDGPRTVGNLVFGDLAASPHNWTLSPGAAGTLTLQVTAGSPLVTVKTATATIAAPLAGTQGFTKDGAGTLVLGGANTYSGVTTLAAGTLSISANANLGASTLVIAGGTLQVTGPITSNRTITLANPASVIQVDGANVYTATGATVSGTGGLTKTGAGTLNLLGAATTYAGPTVVNAGVLSAGNLANTSAVTVNAGTLNASSISPTAPLSVAPGAAANVSGTGATVGSVTNNGTISFSAPTGTVALASLAGAGTTNFAAGASIVTLSTGTVNVAGVASITTASGGTAYLSGPSASITSLGNATIHLGPGTALAVAAGSQTAGSIDGAGGLTKTGTATFSIGVPESYTGGTTVSAGTLQVGTGLAAGSITGNVVDNAVLAFNRSDAYTFAGNISGTGSLLQAGVGTLVLTGANTYTGGTVLNAGTLLLAPTTNIGTGPLSLAGGTLEVSGPVSSARTINLTGTQSAIQVDAGATYTATTSAALVSGVGGLNKTGPGTLDLTAATTTYTGATTVTAGTLNAGALAGTSSVTVNGGTLNVASYKSTAPLSLANGATAIITGTGPTLGSVANAGSLNFTATTGTVSLSGLTGTGTATFSSAAAIPTLSAGTVTVAGVATLTSATGGTANLNGPTASIATLSNATVNLGAGTALTVLAGTQSASGIAGPGSLTKSGSSTFVVATPELYTGGTTISVGTLQIGAGGATGSIPGNVLDNSILAFNRSDVFTFAGNITGTGSLLQSGTGSLVLTGNNSFGGGVTVNAGTLRVGTSSAFPTGSALAVAAGATLDLNGLSVTPSSLTGTGTVILGGAALTINNPSTTTSSVRVTGPGSLVKQGAGTLIITATDDYTGSTTIAAGALQLGNAGATGSILGNVIDNASLVVNRTGSVTLPGNISGSGGLTQTGTGTLTLAGSNTYTGGTNIAGGALALGAPAAFPVATPLNIAAGATFNLNGFNATVSSVAGSGSVLLGSSTLTVRSAANASVSAPISGTGGLVKDGPGDVTLTAPNSYTGPTTANAGRLVLPADSPSSSFTAGAGGTVRIDHATFNLGARQFRALAGGTFEYNNATVVGGFLRGPGTHALLPGLTNTLSGVTTFNSTVVQQNGPALLANVTSGGTFVNNAPMTWDGGTSTGSGSVVVNSTMSVVDWSTAGLVTVNPGGVLSNSLSDLVASAGQITVKPGGRIDANAAAGGTSLQLYNTLLTNDGVVTGTTFVNYGATARGSGSFGPVVVNDGGTFQAAPAAPAPAALASLALTGTAKADVAASAFTVAYSDPSQLYDVRSQLASAYHGGLWDRPGITSSAIAAQPGTAVGYADADLLPGGDDAYGPAILVRFTRVGDVNLDGAVTPDDYALMDRSLARSTTNAVWTDGDLNYDGVINAADCLLLDTGLGVQNGVLSPTLLAQREAQFGAAYVAELNAAVPEPALLGVSIAALLSCPRTRRRALR